MRPVDLHSHSTKSDGTFTPADLMRYAVRKGLKAIALTDHDTVDGLDEALACIRDEALPIELIPGIEFSTVWTEPAASAPIPATNDPKSRTNHPQNGHPDDAPGAPLLADHPQNGFPDDAPGVPRSDSPAHRTKGRHLREHDIHVVGLFLDHHAESFTGYLQDCIDSRRTRNEKMCALLDAAGMPVDYEELCALHPGAVITRAHYGRYLYAKGYVKSIREAFDRYIGDDGPCFVPRETVTPAEAVRTILRAHGVPVLAHPVLYHLPDAHLRALIEEMRAAGLIGIEAIYSTYTQEEERYIRRLAKEYGLTVSGGSDFHGENKPGLDLATGYGSLFVPEDVLERLRAQIPS